MEGAASAPIKRRDPRLPAGRRHSLAVECGRFAVDLIRSRR